MLDLATPQALFMKMAVAITALTHVLKNTASGLPVLKFSNHAFIAKLGQATVDAAFAAIEVPIQGQAELIGAELAVGMLREKVQQSGSSLGVVIFAVCHVISFGQI